MQTDTLSDEQHVNTMRPTHMPRPARWLVLACAMTSVALASGCSGTQKTKTSPVDEPTGLNAGAPAVEAAAPVRPNEAGFGEIEVDSEYEETLDEAVTAINAGNYDDAKELLEEVSEVPGAAAFAYYNLGIIAERQQDPAGALERYKQALGANPDFSPALVNICRIHLRRHDPSGALAAAEKQIALRPDNHNHLDAKLQVLLVTKKFEAVITAAKGILKKDERNVRAMVNMAAAYDGLGKHELASDILKQVSEVTADPSVLADVQYRLGFVHLAMHDRVNARLAFQKAVAIRPDHVEARNNLGVLYHEARDFAGAEEQFAAALRIAPKSPDILVNQGNAQKGLGQYPNAEASFTKAIKIDPKFAPAYFNLGALYLDTESIGGRDKKAQFQLAIDNLLRYKSLMKSALPRDDPADKYIKESKKKIELEKKREIQRREALKDAEADPTDDEMAPDEGAEEGDDAQK